MAKLCLLVCFIVVINLNSILISAIIGGHKSPKRPFFVRVVRLANGKRSACGGTIIHTEWVLTSAHCVKNKNPMEVVIEYGDFTDMDAPKMDINVTKLFWHREHKHAAMRLVNDVGLVKIDNFKFPENSTIDTCSNALNYCTVLGTCGMGRVLHTPESFSPYLKEILLYEKEPSCIINLCPKDVICTRRMSPKRIDNVYHGDSGGPLYAIGEFPNAEPVCVYGIASYTGKFYLDAFGERLIDIYFGGSYFANVPYFYDWIWGVIETHYEKQRQLDELLRSQNIDENQKYDKEQNQNRRRYPNPRSRQNALRRKNSKTRFGSKKPSSKL